MTDQRRVVRFELLRNCIGQLVDLLGDGLHLLVECRIVDWSGILDDFLQRVVEVLDAAAESVDSSLDQSVAVVTGQTARVDSVSVLHAHVAAAAFDVFAAKTLPGLDVALWTFAADGLAVARLASG